MAPKTTRFVVIFAAFVAGLASVFAVLFVVTKPQAGSRVGTAAIGGSFQLIDQNGRPFTDADLKGRPFLVFFGFTHCPDACRTTMNQPGLWSSARAVAILIATRKKLPSSIGSTGLPGERLAAGLSSRS
jgi:hypothetical protein